MSGIILGEESENKKERFEEEMRSGACRQAVHSTGM